MGDERDPRDASVRRMIITLLVAVVLAAVVISLVFVVASKFKQSRRDRSASGPADMLATCEQPRPSVRFHAA